MAKDNNQDIMKLVAPSITMTGRMPSDVVWRFTPTDVMKDIVMIASGLFKDLTIDDVALFLSKDGGKVGAMIKIPKDSHHVQDTSAKDIIIKNPIFNTSKELKEFMEKYCPKDATKLIPDQDKRYFDIAIDIEKIYKVVLDVNGEFAKSKTGNETAYKTQLRIETLRDSRNPDRLKFIEVTKSGKSVFKKEPRPTKSYNFS